jgi:cysteine-rich repeat protein
MLPVLSAFAAPSYSLFGEASIGGGYVTLVSDASPAFGGISFTLSPSITWAQLTHLSTDYNITDDDCGAGSPRIQLRIDTNGDNVSNGNVHIAIGPSPNFTDCLPGWQTTGNLIGNNDTGRYDFSQFGGSTFTTYSAAPASVTNGTVLGMSIVVDSSFSAAATNGDGEMTTQIDNTQINTDLFNYDPAACNGSTFDSFTNGSVNGQGGWAVTGPYDQAVVDNTYGYPTFGCKTWRISNAITQGSFGDQTFSPSIANEAGETSAQNGGMSGGTRQNHFEAEFDVGSAVSNALQTGLAITASPDRGDGARMSYLRFQDQADGIHAYFFDFQDAAPFGTSVGDAANGCDTAVGGEDAFVETDIATIDRSVANTVKFTMDFVEGSRNDIVKIYINGVLKHTGTSWEDYFRYCEGNPTRTVDSLLFRASGTAVPANSGKGFLFDNFDLTSSISPGSLTVHKYVCQESTVITREANAPDANGNITVPAGCTVQSGVNFGYIHQADKTDYSSPYLGLNDATPYTSAGLTDGAGIVTATGLDPAGRYNVAELDGAGNWVEDPGLISFYCAGTDAGTGTNNYEIAFVPSGGATHCVAYNKAPPVCGNTLVETGETCDDGNLNSFDSCSNSCQTQAPQACVNIDNTGLVGYWKLDENGGTTAIDSAGANNNGTLENGPTYVGGNPAIAPNPSALSFDGTDDQVKVMNSGDFTFGTSNFSVTYFVKTNDGERSVLGNYNGSNRGWGSFIYDAERINFFAYGDGGTNDTSFPAPGILNNQWHHVAGTYTRAGANVTIAMYYDGALIGSTTLPVGNITSASDLLLGKYLAQPNFIGTLDDVRVYGRALTPAEIQNFANACTAVQVVCGNGQVEGGETCDDGNLINGDSCSNSCQITTQCSDGVDNADAEDTLTDIADPGCHTDGNATNNASYNPADNDETHVAACLNGVVEGAEQCDDGNNINGDACSNTCQLPPPPPLCKGQSATVYVNGSNKIVGGPLNGQTYAGTLTGTAGNDVIVGTSGNDKIKGSDGNDRICGGNGNDKISGDNGDDTVFGEGGTDELDGGNGNDTLDGGAADDELDGGNGDDKLIGGINKDELDGGNGADILCGGANDDKLDAGSSNDKLDGGQGTDSLKGGSGTDACASGGPGNNGCESTPASIPECVGL